MTKIIGLNGKTSLLNYDENNQIVNVEHQDGRKVVFEYDNLFKDKLISSVSTSGVSSNIKYDDYGNIINIKVINNRPNSEITDGFYKIRAKGTSKYINFSYNGIELAEGYCKHLEWKIEKNGDFYKISHPVLLNKFFHFHIMIFTSLSLVKISLKLLCQNEIMEAI